MDFITSEFTPQLVAFPVQFVLYKHIIILTLISFALIFVSVKLILMRVSKYTFVNGSAFTFILSSVIAQYVLNTLEQDVFHGFIIFQTDVSANHTFFTPVATFFPFLISIAILIYIGMFVYGFWKLKYRHELTNFLADIVLFIDEAKAKFNL